MSNNNLIFNIKNPIYKILQCISFLFFPIALVFLDLNLFNPDKLKNSNFFKLLIIFVILFYIYVIGRENFSGVGISLFEALYIYIIRLILIIFLANGDYTLRKIRITLFTKFILSYIVFSFIWTYFFYYELVAERTLNVFLTNGFQNSTNYINIIVIALTILLILKEKSFFFILILPSFIIAIIWQNRTGIILLPILFLILLLIEKKYLILMSFFIISTTLFSLVVNDETRIGQLGVESSRSLMAIESYNSLISFQYPFGGYKVNYSIYDTFWIHNIFLDTYRLVGIPGFIIVFFVFIYSLIMTLKLKSSKIIGFIGWLISFFIASTSIVFESTHLEFIFIFILIFNFYFLKKIED